MTPRILGLMAALVGAAAHAADDWSAEAGWPGLIHVLAGSVLLLLGCVAWLWRESRYWRARADQQHEALQVLTGSEVRYRQAMNHAALGMALVSPDGYLLQVNEAMCRITGYAQADLEQRHIRDITHPDDFPAQDRLMHLLMQGDIPSYEVQKRYLRPDGSIIWVCITESVVRDGQGRPQAMIAQVQDITRLRHTQVELEQYRDHLEELVRQRTTELADKNIQLEQEIAERTSIERVLREQADYIRSMFDAVKDGILLVSADTLCIRDANQACGAILGRDAVSLVGMGLPSLFELGEPADHCIRILVALVENQLPAHECEFLPAGGSEIHRLEVRARRISSAGEPLLLLMLRDVTEEHAIRKAMQDATRRSLELSQAKSDFLANMSHEIRTPLNAILGLSYLCAQTELTERQREYLDKISHAGNNLLGIVNDILDFSKIEAGKMQLDITEFVVEDLLESVTSMFADRAAGKHLELLCDMDDSVPASVQGDPLRISQILVNLIGNALKFTESGYIELHVSRQDLASDQLVLHFDVRDTGVGIPADKLPVLFEAFEQGDSSTSRRYGGTGLGLSISQRLAHLMGGEIVVNSVPGQGSQFTLSVVVARAREWIRPKGLDCLQGEHALVVDDNPVARQIHQHLLTRLGLQVTCARSGEEALRLIQQQPGHFRHLLIDWQMPGLDGITTIETLRFSGMADLPRCVVVSAFGSEDLVRRARQAGAEHVLFKPLSPSRLARALSPDGRGDASWRPLRDLPQVDLHGVRVLVAEDDPVNQLVVVDLLESTGAEVLLVNNGAEAVERLCVAGLQVDLVLMDVEMPEMNGIEATRRIRQHEALADLPVIALTAHAFTHELQVCREAGMNDHVTKPLNPAMLFAAVESWVGRGTAPRSLPTRTPVQVPEMQAQIPGIDIVEALERVQGKKDLLARLFAEALKRDDAVRLRHLLAAGDVAGAKACIHALKGLSGTISAHAVYALCRDFEDRLRAGERIDWRLPELDAAMAEMMAGIRSYLDPAPVRVAETASLPSGMRPLPAEVRRQLRELRRLCAEGEGSVVEYFNATKHSLIDSGLGFVVDRLGEALHAFDLAQAQGVLDDVLVSAGEVTHGAS